MNKVIEKNAKVTVNTLADAEVAILKRRAHNNPKEKLRQQLRQRQLTVSYSGIYK